MPDRRMLLEHEEHLHQQRSIAETSKLLSRPPKPTSLAGRRNQYRHLVGIARLRQLGHYDNL